MSDVEGMPEGIIPVSGACRKGCGQTLEFNEHGTIECCYCGATQSDTCRCTHQHRSHGPQGFCMVWGCRCMGYATVDQ